MPGKGQTRKHEYPWWLGGMAASMAAVLTHPLDVAKVRMQTSANRSMFGTLAASVKADGLRKGAYPGLSASLMRQMTYSLTRFAVYDQVKAKIRTPRDREFGMPAWKMGIAAGIAGAAGGLTGNPADLILVRMVGDANRPPAERLNYRNCFHGLYRIVRDEGGSALLRGLGPNVSRAIIMNVSQLATYDTFKNSLLNTGFFREGMPLHFAASFMAGTVATTVCAPFDVLKSRIMNASEQSSVIEIVRSSFAKEGPIWMFRGWVPAWIRLSPNTIAIFVLLEQLKVLIDELRGDT